MKKETKEKILESAFELFSKKGYLATTTKEIAQKARVSEVTLFRHFKSKEELFTETIKFHSFLPEFKSLLNKIKDQPYEVVLYKIAEAFLDFLNNKKDFIQLITMESYRYPEKVKKNLELIKKELLETLSLYFEYLKKHKGFKIEEPYVTASAFLGMFFSYFYMKELQGFFQENSFDKEKVLKIFIKIFIKGFKD